MRAILGGHDIALTWVVSEAAPSRSSPVKVNLQLVLTLLCISSSERRKITAAHQRGRAQSEWRSPDENLLRNPPRGGCALHGSRLRGACRVDSTQARGRKAATPIASFDCRRDDRGWHYMRGERRLTCRPDRPREGAANLWGWRCEGPRCGWWHQKDRRWHDRG